MARVYKRITLLMCLILSIFIFNPKVFAGATVSISGASVTQGDTFKVNVNINASENVYSLGGDLSFDGSYLSFGGCSSTGRLGGNIRGQRFGLVDMTYSNGLTSGTVATCTFTANKVGSTSVRINNPEMNDQQTNKIPSSSSAGTINIAAPKSRNANLNSLSVSGCSINFSAGNTNYSCSVDTGVTSVSVSASPQDGGASVSGTGNKSLNYGNNKIQVTVKAPAGNTQSYTVTVNRKDNRSTDNTLSALSVSNGTLSPSFSSKQTNYSIEVPYSVSSLNIKYTTNDSKASVRVNNNSLVAEETVNVTVVVTAENGSTRTYTIAAKRGKDPNKVLNTDNNLVALGIDVGILSPAFNSDVTNYVVYLPYEVDKVNIAYEVSDKRYGVANLHGPETLGVGNNIYTISVKAENEAEKVYTITVVRAKVLNGDSSNNTLLASLSVKNATLTEEFNSSVHLYYYNTNSKKEIVVDAIAQDPEAVVTYLEAGAGVYAVLVTAPSGNMSIYIMLPVKSKGIVYAIIAAVAVLLILIIVLIIRKIKNKNKDDKKEDKKKDKKNKKNKHKEEE